MKVFLIIFIAIFCIPNLSILEAQRPFITTWQTDLPGVSEDNQILIPGTGTGYTIEWKEVGNAANSGMEIGEGATLVSFPTPGIYRISINGNFNRIRFGHLVDNDKEKLLSIDQWGDIRWESMEDAFSGCINMTSEATDKPDLSRVTNLQRMFAFCTSFNGPLEHWDLSNVTNITRMFHEAKSFNQPLGNWNVSNVERMDALFMFAQSFNQNINDWDVSNVTFMPGMFYFAINFNQPLDTWDVSSVIMMTEMFYNASEFNQPIESWDVSNVWWMNSMFRGAKKFNQPLNSWNVSNVFTMHRMFSIACQFDQSLSNWDLRSVWSIDGMFFRSGMSCQNYDSTLMGWYSNPNTPDGLILGSSGLKFRDSQAARDGLIQEKGWTIIGDEFAPCECAVFPEPEIKLLGPPLICDGDSAVLLALYDADQYLWYRNGILLPGESGEELVVREVGSYSLQFRDEYECESGLSEPIEIAGGGAGHPPLMLNANDIRLSSTADNCQGFASFEADIRSCSNLNEVEARSVWKIDVFNTGIFDLISTQLSNRNNLIINEALPLGTHRILWMLRDEFGNESQYEQLLTLTDKNPPVPVCLHGISTSLGNFGAVSLKAEMFDAGSWDDCSASEKLIFSFSSDAAHTHHQWTCEDLQGHRQFYVPVEIWVTNEFGSQNHCNTYLLLQDLREVCPDIDSLTQSVSGRVTNVHGHAVEDVVVKMADLENTAYLHRVTDEEGGFLFGSVGPEYSLIQAEKEGHTLNGLSTLDILLMQKHILGMETMESPYSLIAADVTRDGKIDVEDVNELRDVLLGNSSGFSGNKNWLILPEQSFETGLEVPEYSEVLYLPSSQDRERTYNWTALKAGDVNHSHRLNTAAERSDSDLVLFQFAEEELKAGQVLSLPFHLVKVIELSGFQLTLQFDPGKLKFRNYKSGEVPLGDQHFGFSKLDNGILSVSWSDAIGMTTAEGKELFTLDFEVKKPGTLSDAFWINHQELSPELYSPEGTMAIHLGFESPAENYGLEPMLNIQPNPFRDRALIGFDLPAASEIRYSLIDVSGRELLSGFIKCDPGKNQIEISSDRLPAPGLYFFILQTSDWREVGRVIFEE